MQNFSDKVNFIWSSADPIRATFQRGKYQDVILPRLHTSGSSVLPLPVPPPREKEI
jgi:hypothetical protein